MAGVEPGAGVLLVAAANLLDPNFSRTIVLMCDHGAEGSFGLVLNRQLPLTIQDILAEDPGWTAPLLRGGPVQENTLHFIHRCPNLDISSQEIVPGIYWGGSFEKASEALREGQAKIEDFRFFVGYSGWGSGQLAGEIAQDSWYLRYAITDLVFDDDPENQWRRVLASMGTDYRILANFPDDPRLN